MSPKTKTIKVSIAPIIMILVLLAALLAVYFLQPTNGWNSRVKGNITFEGANINATVSSGQIASGSYEGNINDKFKIITFAEGKEETELNVEISSWQGLELKFVKNDDKCQPITISFSIQNNAEEVLVVDFDCVKGEGEKIDNISISFVGKETIDSFSTENYSITFESGVKENSSLDNFKINISLSNQ